jgi:hypothetical protein
MDKDAIQFVKNALPRGRTLYYDFPDRYALLLLEQAIGDGMEISELKRSTFAKLLGRPRVKTLLAQLGGARVSRDDLLNSWPQQVEAYRLTLGTWPNLDAKLSNWDQTTRRGWNLVLQLNFTMSHNRQVHELESGWALPIYYCHPVAGGEEISLAWARIDLDLETGEALIEEIQSDWVRGAQWRATGPYGDDAWKTYVADVLEPSARRWAETMMTATLWFLLKEIGIRQIFYHTFETGSAMKHITGPQPPRSLYTDLPRRFCFETTHNGPLFIRDSADKKLRRLFTDPTAVWHVLEF